jgi:hypothetical protein
MAISSKYLFEKNQNEYDGYQKDHWICQNTNVNKWMFTLSRNQFVKLFGNPIK